MAEHLYEVVMQGLMDSQVVINRWNYISNDDSVLAYNAGALASVFGLLPTAGEFPEGTIAAGITALQSVNMVWKQAFVRAVYDPADFLEIPFEPDVPGLVDATVSQASYQAFGFRTNRVRLDIGRGYKRISGVTEGATEGLGALNSGVQALCVSLAGLMSSTLVFAGELSRDFVPCVVKKERYTAPSGNYAYRYIRPIDGGEEAQLADCARGVTWESYTKTRTQNSRKSSGT